MHKRYTSSSWLLWLGFGGLLCLIALAGFYGFTTTKAIGTRNERIRTEYLRREQVLQQLRAELYSSGTYIRDLLLETDPEQAESYRRAFRKARSLVESRSAEYVHLLIADDRLPFDRFTVERNRYFEQLQTTLAWTAEQRQHRGITFMKEVLLPQRALVVQLADRLSLANAHQLEAGNREVADLFQQFERNLSVFISGSLFAGVLLAGFTSGRLLRLDRLSQKQLHEVQELSSRLVQVQESERRAIARELHDEVGQSVSGLVLGIGNVVATLSRGQQTPALAQLDDLRHLAERTVASVRDLSLLLRPSMLDDLGLVPALQWHAREVSRTTNIAVQVSADSVSEEQVTEESKICIYRVVQEALNNVVRHAAATAVHIRLSPGLNRTLALEIEDNGRGFTPREKGLGILGMEERVRYRKGTLEINSEPGRGTILSIRLPS